MTTTPLPSGLGVVAPRELALHGITSLEDVVERSERELLAIHGVGPRAIRILAAELASRGLRFRDPEA